MSAHNLDLNTPSATVTGLTEGGSVGIIAQGDYVVFEVELSSGVWTQVHHSRYGAAVIYPLPGTKVRATLEGGGTAAVVAVTPAA